jgi:hypothetical protein
MLAPAPPGGEEAASRVDAFLTMPQSRRRPVPSLAAAGLADDLKGILGQKDAALFGEPPERQKEARRDRPVVPPVRDRTRPHADFACDGKCPAESVDEFVDHPQMIHAP